MRSEGSPCHHRRPSHRGRRRLRQSRITLTGVALAACGAAAAVGPGRASASLTDCNSSATTRRTIASSSSISTPAGWDGSSGFSSGARRSACSIHAPTGMPAASAAALAASRVSLPTPLIDQCLATRSSSSLCDGSIGVSEHAGKPGPDNCFDVDSLVPQPPSHIDANWSEAVDCLFRGTAFLCHGTARSAPCWLKENHTSSSVASIVKSQWA